MAQDFLPWAQAHLKVARMSEMHVHAHCPLHDDAHPSFSINRRTGKWHCFGCDRKGIINDLCRAMNLPTFEERPSISYESLPPAVEQEVEKRHLSLLANSIVKARLHTEWGIDEKTIARFKLGYDDTEARVWIPIYFDGHLVNVRRYKFGAQVGKVLNVKGVKKVFPFPFENLSADDIVLCEGEKDCIVANFYGIKAVTFTGGAQTVPDDDILGLFQDKIVRICYDCDKAGEQGTLKVLNALKGIAARVYVVALPAGELGNGGDVTDFFQKGYSAKAFQDLIALSVQRWPVLRVEKDTDDEVHSTTALDARQPGFYARRVRFVAMCIGKALQPFTVPHKGVINCANRSKDVCALCKISELPANSLEGLAVQIEDVECDALLEMIDVRTKEQRTALERAFGLMCGEWEWVSEIHLNVEQLILSHDPLSGGDSDEPLTHEAYYVGSLPIGENLTYEFTGRHVRHPKTQVVTHIFTHAITPHGFLRQHTEQEGWGDALMLADY